MVDLSKTRRKIEDIPSDSGKVVDTIAGALLRTFEPTNSHDGGGSEGAAISRKIQRQIRALVVVAVGAIAILRGVFQE